MHALYKWRPQESRSFLFARVVENKKTSLYSANYVRWQRGTARIGPPHAATAAVDRYLLPAGSHTATNLQRRVCCCGPMLGQTDRRTDGHRTVSQTLFRMLFGQCRYLYVNCCTTVETSYTANPLQIKVTELGGYSWPTCSKQPRLIDCRIGVVNKLDHRDRVDKKWRNFLSPEFPTKFPGEVYVVWRHPDFLITQYKIGQKVSVPKTGSIRPAVIIKTRTDRQTGGRTTTANAALA